ncbi:Uncharacterised protein [Mycobacteroides abscessus subsp. abscessus]|nr:Uncharacterised protein [Mycobacteroides abscessus subsp. abscessus]
MLESDLFQFLYFSGQLANLIVVLRYTIVCSGVGRTLPFDVAKVVARAVGVLHQILSGTGRPTDPFAYGLEVPCFDL